MLGINEEAYFSPSLTAYRRRGWEKWRMAARESAIPKNVAEGVPSIL